jgi:hypothetical protein
MQQQSRLKQNLKSAKLGTMILVAILVAIAVYFINGKYQHPKPEPSPKITSLSPQSQEIKSKLFRTERTSGDISSEYEEYRIDYLISNDEFIVTIKKEPYSESKKKAENWFLVQGFKPEELCIMKITFYPAKDVVPDIAQGHLPTGFSD